MTKGVVYVAYGAPAVEACRRSVVGLQDQYDVAVISDSKTGIGQHVYAPDADQGARWAKLSIDGLSPFEYTAYLDADTIPLQSIETGFEILADGWDMVVTPSDRQGTRSMYHLIQEEREQTIAELGFESLQLQGGVMFFRKSDAIKSFFAAWRVEWQRWNDKDQGALLRAMQRVPLKIWLLGRPWNGGAVIEHHFGKAARK